MLDEPGPPFNQIVYTFVSTARASHSSCITYQWCCLRVLASLEEPKKRIDRMVLLKGCEGEWRKIDITRVLLLCIESCLARVGIRLLVGDGDARIDG